MAKKTIKSLVKADAKAIIPAGYKELLNELKEKIRNAQLKAALAVNEELIRLYWDLGKTIVEKHRQEKWGCLDAFRTFDWKTFQIYATMDDRRMCA